MTPRERANGILPLLRHKGYGEYDVDPNELAAGIAAEIDDAVREEREACAKLADEATDPAYGLHWKTAHRIADSIRSRGAAPEKQEERLTGDRLLLGKARGTLYSVADWLRAHPAEAARELLEEVEEALSATADSLAPEERHPCIECGNDYAEGYCPHENSKADPVPPEVHDRGWQWRPVGDDSAFAPPFGTIRACRGCGCLLAGGPTTCSRCAEGTK